MAKYLEMEARAGMMSTAKLSEGRKQPEPAKKRGRSLRGAGREPNYINYKGGKGRNGFAA